jgi:hypothetical protein
MVNTSRTTDVEARTGIRTPVEKAALAVGVVFLIVGVAGFIPGLTSNYDTMHAAGHESDALLMGVFQVSVLHNIVHILFGVAGVALARRVSGARGYLVAGGVIYALLWIYGLVVHPESAANFVPLNSADNWLHLFLAVGMIALGLALPPRGGDITR